MKSKDETRECIHMMHLHGFEQMDVLDYLALEVYRRRRLQYNKCLVNDSKQRDVCVVVSVVTSCALVYYGFCA